MPEQLVLIISSELESLKQHITELEAENAELRKENTVISDLRNKLSISDAEIAELKHMHTEVLRANEEYNEMRNAENVKLKAIIEELKSENVELRDYVTKVKESKAEQASLNQDQESDIRCSTSEKISEVINPVTKISAGAPSQNSYRKKGAENIIQLIADGIIEDAISLRPTQLSDKAIICDIILIESLNQNSSTDPLLSLAQLFDKADDTEYGAIQANQEEILRWYYYRKEFLNQVSVIVQDNKGKIGEKKAKRIVYDKMLEHLSMLRNQSSGQNHVFKNPEISERIINALLALESIEVNTSANVLSAPQSNSTYDCTYFHNKTLDQYSTLYRKFSSENFDYYRITDEKLCMVKKKPENKVSYLSSSEQCEEKEPIIFEVRPDPELIIKSVLEYFLYLKFRNSFRGIDNYDFTSPQPWSSPCPICDGIHENYGLYGSWYCENGNQLPYDPELAKFYSQDKLEYCLTCNTSSNKLKFAIVA
ncbi:hypothetical protein RclHR1_17470005 [Rhizophagus clarus]|uniref:Uncharacterized protein n=1 Tax=Rhizophagus clarus TaxID=94130 RepID=A0A2Z6QK53_9GLOM|nr:hypothetical protein RclHR1_17470005 [Rhizophagus clarus]